MSVALEDSTGYHNPRKLSPAHDLTQSELLWRSVLAQAIRDIYSGNPKERSEVVNWIRTKDFETVCEFAQVEVTSMQQQMASLIEMPLILAKKYGKVLRDQIMYGIHFDT